MQNGFAQTMVELPTIVPEKRTEPGKFCSCQEEEAMLFGQPCHQHPDVWDAGPTRGLGMDAGGAVPVRGWESPAQVVERAAHYEG